jgi:acyl-CoA synthetase (AMP-forming)/AMP-acid ligase II
MLEMPNLTPQTIAEAIEQHAARHPKQVALVGSEFAPFSFQELDQQIRHIGRQLREAGIGSLSRVAIVLPEGPEAAVIAISIASHAMSVPCNPNLTVLELKEELKRIEIDAIVLPSWVDLPVWSALENGPIGVFWVSKAARCLANVVLQQIHPVPVTRRKSGSPSANSPALILKSSGTTDKIKLIPNTHINLLAMASKMQSWFGLGTADRSACILPVHYGGGAKAGLLMPLLLGGSVALPDHHHVEELSDWISDLQPTWFTATPPLLQAILDRLRSGSGKYLEHRLRFITCTASNLPDVVRSELESILRIPILAVYGISEAGIMAANPAPPREQKPGTVGLIPPNELAIKGSDDELLPFGKIGEIVIRGPSVMPGYLNEVDSEVSGFHQEWLATGDLGFIDAQAYLTIVGRTKELINRGGEKILPDDVEQVLLNHPSVFEAAAFPVPHPRLGENVAAAVTLRPGANATPNELREYVAAHLAPFKVPQRLFILESLPKGPTGKILRLRLPQIVSGYKQSVIEANYSLEHQILEIWKRLLGSKNIGIEDNFFEAGGDSLLAQDMLLEVETLTKQAVPQSALREAYTVRQLANAITRATPLQNETVTCARPGSGVPFFYCHGDWGGRGFYALKLADRLGFDQPVYLLHPATKPRRGSQFTIEEIAQSYLAQVLAIHPSGCFRLGGFCHGGLIAWELAYQLSRVGREVECVVLIDTISINARRGPRAVQKLVRLLSRFLPRAKAAKIKDYGMNAVWDWLNWSRSINWRNGQIIRNGFNWLASVNWKSPQVIRRTVGKVFGSFQEGSKLGLQTDILDLPYFRSMCNYLPPKIDSEVFCLVCEENRLIYRFSPSPWCHLARFVRCEYLPGEHFTCITIHVDELANVLRRLFLKKWNGPSATISPRRESVKL